MSHYAKVLDGKVIQVITTEAAFFNTFIDSSPGQWIQTSYNTHGGVHLGTNGQSDGGVALRGNYAGIGYTYDAAKDIFYAPQPYPSWILNTTTFIWNAPVSMPIDGQKYQWNEASLNWVVNT